MYNRRTLLTSMLALGATGVAVPSFAKDKAKDKPGKNKAKSIGNGKGADKIPPGQIKKYTRGAKLPGDLKWDSIGDLSKWKLKPPGNGNRYIKVDNEILEVTEDLSTVVDAVGIVDDLLR
ncbi:hypothetical protein [Shimia abyssi]|uniref:Nickel/cobalt transporter regulator n=1 Tax=Shimia abyssi TaxID=1662395 RepID=A0A2P8F5V8_9RHOB|nr:hypothetical protein [Shimia abyssi]PSL17110.1 hypothetical protein CLV88_12120 [Shimia abyssi]